MNLDPPPPVLRLPPSHCSLGPYAPAPNPDCHEWRPPRTGREICRQALRSEDAAFTLIADLGKRGSGKTSLSAVPGPGLNQWTWLLPAFWSRNLWAKQTPGTVHGKSPTSPGRVSRGSQAPVYPVPGTQENLCPPPPTTSSFKARCYSSVRFKSLAPWGPGLAGGPLWP